MKDTSHWFKAKRHGWGWGLPTCWQGWLVYAGYGLLLAVGLPLLLQGPGRAWAAVYVAVLSAALLGICWRKGEPARWRWGAD